VDISPDEIFSTPDTTTFFLFPVSERFPKGVSVTLKNTISYGESLAVTDALLQGMSMTEAVASAMGEETSSKVFTSIGKQKRMKLAVRITQWNFPGPDGQAVKWPANLKDRFQVIDGLNEKVGDWLEERVLELEKRDEAVMAADPEIPGEVHPLALRPVGGSPD
jgi:hypothetical protein